MRLPTGGRGRPAEGTQVRAGTILTTQVDKTAIVKVVLLYLGRLMERGPSRQVHAAPRHLHTKALLATDPRSDAAAPMEAVGTGHHGTCIRHRDLNSQDMPPESRNRLTPPPVRPG